MKTKFFKSMLLPLATVVLGLAGAFATTSMASSKLLVDQRGFYELDEDHPCTQSILCQNVVSDQLCQATISGITYTLKGKVSPTAATCPVTLYRKP